MNLNILIAGVGGQGNLFASSILAQYFIGRGYQVLAVETIGAAQRGAKIYKTNRPSNKFWTKRTSPSKPMKQVSSAE